MKRLFCKIFGHSFPVHDSVSAFYTSLTGSERPCTCTVCGKIDIDETIENWDKKRLWDAYLKSKIEEL